MRECLWFIMMAVMVLMAATNGSAQEPKWSVTKLPGTYKFTEGPMWTPWGTLLFSDCNDNKIWEISNADAAATRKVFRDPAGPSNGLTFDMQGRLIACDYGHHRVTRTEKDGKITVLAESYEGKRLNSPNDIIVRSDGSIYFTDPSYGVKEEDRELDFKGVFLIKPDGRLVMLTKDFDMPNGLCLSADEKKLYIADSSNRRHIRLFDVAKDGSISGGEVIFTFPKTGVPDGMKIGQDGNLYSSGPAGIWVFDPLGKHLYTIPIPEVPANLAFGDKDGKTLYITARTGVYRARQL
ncbi:MAG: SMP-30/gluconolactonase/LRE family protein [Armatimonadetes bacterium]|nr:SMP-30/gluconolactonase/LRE family protein [Armatimonadota bacterium]